MKKVLSVILALAMLMACSLMVFAAEPCEHCTGGTVVWTTDWTREKIPFAKANCDIHPNRYYSIYKEYRLYACRDCGEIAFTECRNAYVCDSGDGAEHTERSTTWFEFP